MTTYEERLARMLSKVPDTVDKRKGSLLYLALSPVAYELTLAENEREKNNESISLNKAIDQELTDLCAQNGTFRKHATYAQRKGIFNISIPIGNRFGIEDTTYIVISKITDFEYVLQCEQIGEIGNIYTGAMLPITPVDGLTIANLSDIIIPGAEEETNEQLRERHKQNIINPPQDGNTAQYLNWATDYEGIGIAKVFPLWNGGNTIKVAITNRLFLVAEAALVEEFQQYMDPDAQGLGNGVAPLGAKVTIVGGTKKDINITANIVLTEGYTEAEGAALAISNYLASIVYIKNSVSYMRIGSALLDCPSIADLSNLTLNGGTLDIALINDEIPVLNSLNLTVVN